jgi:hypothetical protein
MVERCVEMAKKEEKQTEEKEKRDRRVVHGRDSGFESRAGFQITVRDITHG